MPSTLRILVNNLLAKYSNVKLTISYNIEWHKFLCPLTFLNNILATLIMSLDSSGEAALICTIKEYQCTKQPNFFKTCTKFITVR